MVQETNHNLFQCDECGLHYRDAKQAAECQKWCAAHNACSLLITRQSVEVQEALKKS